MTSPAHPNRNISATARRKYAFPDHRPPSGRHANGRERGAVWQGTSRIIEPAARRRAQRRSWRKELARGRREAAS